MVRTVGECMTRRVVTVQMDDSLKTIREIFNNVKFHHLLVLDEKNHLVGVISDRDLLRGLSPFLGTMAESPRDQATLNKRAHQVMVRRPVTTTTETRVPAAAAMMLEEKVSCLPVLAPDGTIVGILTMKDLVRCLIPPPPVSA